jgi:hypothetical protein
VRRAHAAACSHYAPVGASKCGPKCMSSVNAARGSPNLRGHIIHGRCTPLAAHHNAACQRSPESSHFGDAGNCVEHVRAPQVHNFGPLRKRLRIVWHVRGVSGAAYEHRAIERAFGTTGAALSSSYRVLPAAGRGPTRQKKRHLGSGPLGMVARCSSGCACTTRAQSGSIWRERQSRPERANQPSRSRHACAVTRATRTVHRGVSTSSGVAPT